MHVEVMLRNMVRLHRWISFASVARYLEPLMKLSTAGLRRQLWRPDMFFIAPPLLAKIFALCGHQHLWQP